MTVSSKVNETISSRLASVRNATRLMRCFLGAEAATPGMYDTGTGDVKSARGPDASLETVLATERKRTWVEVAALSVAAEEPEEGGRDNTMVPILEMTISHCCAVCISRCR